MRRIKISHVRIFLPQLGESAKTYFILPRDKSKFISNTSQGKHYVKAEYMSLTMTSHKF